jgi:predicted nicotinamide N-methyase
MSAPQAKVPVGNKPSEAKCGGALRGFPLNTLGVWVGSRLWRVRCAEDQHRLLAATKNLEQAPYGFLLWESSVALSRWLAVRPELVRGKRVLELGAGVGLAGLVAQSLGASVTQTDHLPEALALSQLNATENGIEGVRRQQADWHSWDHAEHYDVILGADILYETEMQSALSSIFRRNLTPDGSVLLADPLRPQSLEFLGRMQDAATCAELATEFVAPTCAAGGGMDVEVLLVRLKWSAGAIGTEKAA